MLTSKQKELLMLIHARLQESGVPPSFDEMKEALELKSKSGIHRLITALEERGFIRRLPHRARALEILKMPESALGPSVSAPPSSGFSESPQQKVSGFQPSIIEGGGKKAEEARAKAKADSTRMADSTAAVAAKEAAAKAKADSTAAANTAKMKADSIAAAAAKKGGKKKK